MIPGASVGALVGRSTELAALRADLEAARSGRAGAVLLAGDAGIGKSRLAAELAGVAEASGFRVVVGRCLDTGSAPLPYLPISEVVGELVATDPELVAHRPALRGLLPDGGPAAPGGNVPAPTDRDSDRLQVFDAVAGALREVAATAPLLVVLEDLHWSDRSTRELVAYLLSRLGSQRLLVLATYRTDDLHRRHPLRSALAELVRLPAVRRAELGPLAASDVLALVRDRAALTSGRSPGGSPAEDVLHRIADRSGGNAFYAEEMVAAGRAGLTDALADVLLTRLDQLSEPARTVLQVVSVAERRIPHDLLAEAAGLSPADLAAGLREAVSHHVLVPAVAGGVRSEAYAFRHALLREAVHDDLLPDERVRLHARLAELLSGRTDEPGVAADLARHALAAHDLPRALAASVAAMREADRRHGPAEMLVHAERALELWSAVPGPERVACIAESTLHREAAWAASASGAPERGAALGARAVEVADLREGPLAQAVARRRYAMRLLDRGAPPEEAIEVAAAAVALRADAPPDVEQAWSHAVLARSLLSGDRGEQAWRHARAALDVADRSAAAADPGDPEHRARCGARADALITLAFCARIEGDPGGARERLARATELAAESGNRVVELRTVWNRAVSFVEDGLLDDAARELTAGSRRAEGYGLSWGGYGFEFRVARVRVDFQRGAWDEALRVADEVDPAVSVRVTGVLVTAGLLVRVARGELDTAERVLAELSAEPPPHDQAALLQGVVGAEAALWRAAPDVAADRVADALARIRAEYPYHLGALVLCALGAQAHAEAARAARASGLPDDAHVAAAQSRVAEAELTAQRGLPRGTEVGPEGRAWLARARAEAHRAGGTHAPETWAAVAEAFAGHGDHYRAAEAHLRRAEALLARAHGVQHTHAPDVAAAEDERAPSPADDRRAAEAALRCAAATAEQLGAIPLATAVAALAARSGGDGTTPGPAAPDGASPLTRRERAVLEQVAHGLTNRAIGETLFISEKTVSVHLSRAMAKLGASGRAEAVSVAHSRGLLPPHG
ncbi:helix-turn-helix transcriptional regulator [Pseudonocardia phyllosphaerae]|uniref:helix-turn-helix transcriptional regulator n=1 Tax=Pseudonocardia phyllosphaerae TaxID=3390502 RepID=UPI00397CD685